MLYDEFDFSNETETFLTRNASTSSELALHPRPEGYIGSIFYG